MFLFRIFTLFFVLIYCFGCVTESQIAEIQSRISEIESKLNINKDERSLKVVTNELNIRQSPNASLNNNIIAKAYEGAFFRTISCSDKKCSWYKVEFLIANYSYYGFVFNNSRYLIEQYLDPMTFDKVHKRGLIKYNWTFEVNREMKSNRYKNLGLYFDASPKYNRTQFLGHIARVLRNYKIYTKPIQDFNVSDTKRLCTTNDIDAILRVEILPSKSLNLFLIDKNTKILYSTEVPLQSIELPM